MFVTKKRFDELVSWSNGLSEKVKSAEKRIRQLECSHDCKHDFRVVGHRIGSSISYFVNKQYERCCSSCGKVLTLFYYEDDYNKAQAEYYSCLVAEEEGKKSCPEEE